MRFQVPATSAFILLFTRALTYQTEVAKRLLASVDLTAADPIKGAFADMWDEIYEGVANRKFAVGLHCRQYLDANPDAQVVGIGGGLDPLSLDLAASYPKARFFDVDLAQMDLKQEINAAIGGPDVAFCTADLTDPAGLVSVLSGAGWSQDRPTLLVAEGITYYVPKPIFKAALGALRTRGGGLVIEYSLPDELVAGTPNGDLLIAFFERLTTMLEMSFPMQRYTDEEVHALAKELGGSVTHIRTQLWMERMRKGVNEFFVDGDDIGLHVAMIQLD